jgi:RHS repeat-associated protein
MNMYRRQLGLVRFGARDYDPEIGRWVAKERLLFAAGRPNSYLYVSANPQNRIDIDGLLETDLANAISIVRTKIPEIYAPDFSIEFADLSAYGGGSGAFGRTSRTKKQILISDEFSGELSKDQRLRLLDTVIHEYMHATDSFVHNILRELEDRFDIGDAHTDIHKSANGLADMYEYLLYELGDICAP